MKIPPLSAPHKGLFRFTALLITLGLMSGLSACGGGGGGDKSDTPPEPYITRISVDANGVGGNGNSTEPAISADGRYVVFESIATNLVSNDTNGVQDVFVRDMQTLTTTRVSVDSSGVEGDARSRTPQISGDGRYVVFRSSSTNLVDNDTNGVDDVFLHDRVTGNTSRVSIADGINGDEGNGVSYFPSISPDGGYIAFASFADNLVANDNNGEGDVFVRDLANSTTIRVSIADGVNGAEGNARSNRPKIGEDGLYVAFESNASNLVSNDTNGWSDIFLRDITNNTTTRVNIATGVNGAEADNESLEISLSGDVRFVAFATSATNLIGNDTNGSADVFLRDTVTQTTTRISVNSSGGESDGFSGFPQMSADGVSIAFNSSSTNLVQNDSNAESDVFLHDTQSGETTRISVNVSGVEGDDRSRRQSMSADGRYVVFESEATNLVNDDSQMETDIFRVKLSELP